MQSLQQHRLQFGGNSLRDEVSDKLAGGYENKDLVQDKTMRMLYNYYFFYF